MSFSRSTIYIFCPQCRLLYEKIRLYSVEKIMQTGAKYNSGAL
uniref:Uncharacterized protein n=1 Tax=Ciona intestinalis TaxID=7719 RepID=H2Y2X0_CIOIN